MPSSALPASATTKAATRCFVGSHPLASSPDRFRTIVPGGPPGEPVTGPDPAELDRVADPPRIQAKPVGPWAVTKSLGGDTYA